MKYKEKMLDYTFADTDFSNLSSFIFRVNHIFVGEKDKLVEKNATNEEELDDIEIDGILDLENLPRTISID